MLRNVLTNQECVRRWRETEVLFIAEVSMLSKRTFDVVQYIALNVRNLECVFGGLQVVAFGAFYSCLQCPSAIDSVEYSFQSAFWDLTFPHQIILEESFWSKEDQEVVSVL